MNWNCPDVLTRYPGTSGPGRVGGDAGVKLLRSSLRRVFYWPADIFLEEASPSGTLSLGVIGTALWRGGHACGPVGLDLPLKAFHVGAQVRGMLIANGAVFLQRLFDDRLEPRVNGRIQALGGRNFARQNRFAYFNRGRAGECLLTPGHFVEPRAGMFKQHEQNLERLLLQADAALALAQLTGAGIEFKLPESNCWSRRVVQ